MGAGEGKRRQNTTGSSSSRDYNCIFSRLVRTVAPDVTHLAARVARRVARWKRTVPGNVPALTAVVAAVTAVRSRIGALDFLVEAVGREVTLLAAVVAVFLPVAGAGLALGSGTRDGLVCAVAGAVSGHSAVVAAHGTSRRSRAGRWQTRLSGKGPGCGWRGTVVVLERRDVSGALER
jgi:hypothetical protein